MNDEPPKEEPEEKETEEPEVIEEQAEEIKEEKPVEKEQSEEKHKFIFDVVLNEKVTNDEVYRETVEPIVSIIFERTKAACFTYGQPGIGKAFTI